MQRSTILLLLACSFGCRPNYATVDEACDGKVPGSGGVTNEEAVEVFGRINCYRRLARMGRANMDKRMQAAVQNHIGYLSQNFVVEDWSAGTFNSESPGNPGFTGADIYTRLEEAGYTGFERGALGVWDFYYWDDEDAVSRIDFWFHDPEARQAFLQPAWTGGGYADGPLNNVDSTLYSPNMANMNTFYTIPVIDHVSNPVVYPKDGQEDVPTGFSAVDPNSGAYPLGAIGYPITVTVGADSQNSGANAHGISVKNATLTGGGGPVELEIQTGDQSPTLRYTVAIYPLTELQPNTTYDFEIEMSWVGQDDRTITSSFTTGPAFAPHSRNINPSTGGTTSRGLPRPPILVHHILDPAGLIP